MPIVPIGYPLGDGRYRPIPDIEAEEPSALVDFSPHSKWEENTVLLRRYPLALAAVSHLPMLGNFRMEER